MLSNEAFERWDRCLQNMGGCSLPVPPWTRTQRGSGSIHRDQIAKAVKDGGIHGGEETMIRLLETDHLNDQLAGLAWLQKQTFVQANRIAVAGNSFGGIETVLGAEAWVVLCRNRCIGRCPKLAAIP